MALDSMAESMKEPDKLLRSDLAANWRGWQVVSRWLDLTQRRIFNLGCLPKRSTPFSDHAPPGVGQHGLRLFPTHAPPGVGAAIRPLKKRLYSQVAEVQATQQL